MTAAAFPRKLDASGGSSRATAALWGLVGLGGALYAGMTAALFADAAGPARWTAVLAGGALLGAGWWLAPRTDPRGGLIAVAVGAVLFRLLLLPAPGRLHRRLPLPVGRQGAGRRHQPLRARPHRPRAGWSP